MGLSQGLQENFYGKEDVDIVITDDIIITNTDNTTQYVMLRSSDNGVLGKIFQYKDINGNDIVIDNIKDAVIQGSVTSIGPLAFLALPALQSVVIGDSVTSIGRSAFNKCNSLQSVIMGNNVEFIGQDPDRSGLSIGNAFRPTNCNFF